jgi:hypothetical protein
VLVVLAVEMLQPKGFGRIRLRRIENDSDECVVPFVQESIEPGAQVRPDGSAAYRSLSKLGYDHQRTVMLGSEVAAHVHGRRAPGGLAGQAMDAGNASWLRPNRTPGRLSGRVRVPLQSPHFGLARMLFYRLLQQAVVTEPVTYDSVVRPLHKPTQQA